MNSTDLEARKRQEPVYEIRLAGHLADRWACRFEGLTIILTESDETLLIGPVTDQAALHGLLKKVRDLGIPLLAVNRVSETYQHHTYKGEQK
jgi:hypothetical protein